MMVMECVGGPGKGGVTCEASTQVHGEELEENKAVFKSSIGMLM